MTLDHDFTVASLGRATIASPIVYSTVYGDSIANYVGEDERILYDIEADPRASDKPYRPEQLLEKAGPRQAIHFDPPSVHAALVTCGGLCPGLNDVVRAITRCLWYRYGVRRITGVRYGYAGLLPGASPPLGLDPDVVDDIHRIGGSVLGSSRGSGELTSDIVDTIERHGITMLFAIGGDGTQKGALKVVEEIARRGLDVAVVGVPKTIDNDLAFIQRSFGFETAVAEAARAIASAHSEAHSALNGIGLVKLMGRDSGFIAAHTAVASHDANFVLVPEVPFDLEGPNGFLAALEARLERRNHAVIIVAEGAGQEHLEAAAGTDASGNRKLADIGPFLRDRIAAHFRSSGTPINLKYIDPSYMIRSAVAAPTDALYCSRLGNNAAHAAMAGKTGMIVSQVNSVFVHVPIRVAVSERNRIDPESSLWRDVIEATHQPVVMKNA